MEHAPVPGTPVDASRRCWAAQRRLTVWLLLLWLVASFGVAWFAPHLSSLDFFGWPLSFYMAAQGSPLVFILVVALYARAANTLESDQGRGGH